MQFTKIDINNWTRKEYFDHYFDNTPCTYSMTVKLDISKLKKGWKKIISDSLIWGYNNPQSTRRVQDGIR